MLSSVFIDHLKPVKFHPYTSDTRKKIFQKELDDEFEELRYYLVELFTENEIKCYPDNKIVFECEIHGTKIYYGFYDLKFSIGLDYYSEHDSR